MPISTICLNRSMDSKTTITFSAMIAAVAIVFALGPTIVNQASAYGGYVGYGSYGGYVGYHHHHHHHHHYYGGGYGGGHGPYDGGYGNYGY